MNYYPFHVGDYRRDTHYLTHEGHYIYRTLLDEYYHSEGPLPLDKRALLRKCGLTTDQMPLLEGILDDFFLERSDGYMNKHCERVIGEYKVRAETARINGSKGGRPPKPKRTRRVTVAIPNLTGSKANQEPITKNQEPVVKDNVSLRDTGETGGSTVGVPFKEIARLWNIMATEQDLPLVEVDKMPTTIKGQLRQRHKDLDKDLNRWFNFFKYIAGNDFLAGRAPPGRDRSTPFRATLLWVTKQLNFHKIAAKEFDQ